MGGPNRTGADWWEFARALGVKFQHTHLAKGANQKAVARTTDVSTFTYQKFEKGESKSGTPMNPRLRALLALAETSDVGAGELVGG